MRRRYRLIVPMEDRGPLRVMFVITCMPIGGAETLLVELIRRLDRRRFAPELCCLKYFGPLGDVLAKEIPAFTGVLAHKYDPRVLPRLTRLMEERKIDAVVTVGTGGDKMFWGRLCGKLAGVPVLTSAIHSTGVPDHVEFLNRLLTPITDGFVAVAESHARYLTEHEGCPPNRVFVIPNGVDVEKFRPCPPNPRLRRELGLPPEPPVAGIVAALRPEKNHPLFLHAARLVLKHRADAQFLVVGDGEERSKLESLAERWEISGAVHFLGTRSDVPDLLSLMDVLVLSSHMEASPVSLLEGMACGKPVVATAVGSIPENVHDGVNGFQVPPGDAEAMAERILLLFDDHPRAREIGLAGREHVVAHASVARMVRGYEEMLAKLYQSKAKSLVVVEKEPCGVAPI